MLNLTEVKIYDLLILIISFGIDKSINQYSEMKLDMKYTLSFISNFIYDNLIFKYGFVLSKNSLKIRYGVIWNNSDDKKVMWHVDSFQVNGNSI